jgi:DnaD/phage-associated family protein
VSYDPPIEPPIEDNNNNTSSSSSSSAPHSVVSVPAKPEPQPASPETLAYADLCALYENNIGLITPIMAGTLRTALATFPAPWIEHAIALAVRNEKRRWNYVEGILLNWQREGFNANRTQQQSANLPAARAGHRTGNRPTAHSGGSVDPIAREQHATEWGPEWFEGLNDELPAVDTVA